MKLTKLTLIVALTLVLGMTSFASAGAITGTFSLQEIMDTGAITVSDKVFSDFTLFSPASDDPNAVSPGADAIEVTGWQYTAGEYAGEVGLRFDGPWQAGYQKVAGSTIGFRVQVDDPNVASDNTLFSSSWAAVDGGSAGVTENVFHTNPNEGPATSFVEKYIYTHGSGNKVQTDHVEWDPADFSDDFWVTVGVSVTGGNTDPAGSAQLNDFFVTFSQIPEPTTMAILGLGGLTALLRRKRQ
jgi:hypothetical protein